MGTTFSDHFVVSEPVVSGQLGFRIGLARKRTALYPMDSLDFIMLDLERPDTGYRHAHWCTGDLTGRLLEFLAAAEGVDGQHDERLPVLFERILLQRRPKGYYGRYVDPDRKRKDPGQEGQDPHWLGARLFPGLVRYYQVTGDWRALDWAVEIANEVLAHKDTLIAPPPNPSRNLMWITEPGAHLYGITGEQRYLELCEIMIPTLRACLARRFHTHMTLSTVRGLQLAALYTDDQSWDAIPEQYRALVQSQYAFANGDVAEATQPNNFRNEGCAVADWLQLNLYSAALSNDPGTYDAVENILWNGVFFNQLITGGFGQRDILPYGYAETYMEGWNCCTENAGLAMADLARQAVVVRDGMVHVNFLYPGTYAVSPLGCGAVTVRITSDYPASAKAVIDLWPAPEGLKVQVRLPKWVRGARLEERRIGDQLRLNISGRLGYELEEVGENVMLRYGPLVLAPLTYYWKIQQGRSDEAIPENYVPPALPGGRPQLLVGPADAEGFLKLEHLPLPDWSYIDEGPVARCAVGSVSANVRARFRDGSEQTLRFIPLCYFTAMLNLYETPIIFPKTGR